MLSRGRRSEDPCICQETPQRWTPINDKTSWKETPLASQKETALRKQKVPKSAATC